MNRHVYLHSEDLDGWLALPNHPILPLYQSFLREMQGLTLEHEGALHEVQVVLNSGKAPEYLECEAARFGGRFIISANGAAWREVGHSTRRLVPPTRDFEKLRRLLGLAPGHRDVVTLQLPEELRPPPENPTPEVALEDKRDGLGEIVFSLFPEPEPVAHRWSFAGGIDRHTLKAYLVQLVEAHGLELDVPPPHRDGAVDVLPLLQGRPVGKWTLPLLARQMFPSAELHLTHGGDGTNDLSAMESEGVTPLTAQDCPDVVEVVQRRGGVVAAGSAPEGRQLIECYAELARRNWYGPLSTPVASICETFRTKGMT